MAGESHCYLSVSSEHFLGTEAKCRAFLDVLTTIDGGRWIPDKWQVLAQRTAEFLRDKTNGQLVQG
jgi:hypothetical protein